MIPSQAKETIIQPAPLITTIQKPAVVSQNNCSENHQNNCSENHQNNCSENHQNNCSENHQNNCSDVYLNNNGSSKLVPEKELTDTLAECSSNYSPLLESQDVDLTSCISKQYYCHENLTRSETVIPSHSPVLKIKSIQNT